MGWASGSQVMNDIIDTTKRLVHDKELRKKLYEGYIAALEDQDWDTQCDCFDQDEAFDEVWEEIERKRYGEPH